MLVSIRVESAKGAAGGAVGNEQMQAEGKPTN
jgi:uncharacterized protein YjbJ (UPF0337 family)